MHIEIRYYNGEWQEAFNPQKPKVGEYVQIYEDADARQYEDFNRCLRKWGLELEFLKNLFHPTSGRNYASCNEYRIVEREQES